MNSLLPFIIASAVLLIVPGPAVIYIVTRSVDQRRLAGIVSMLDIQVGASDVRSCYNLFKKGS